MLLYWLHHLDSDKTLREKARWELHKNAKYSFEQILKAAFHKIAAVQPPISHLANYPRKTNMTSGTLLEKQGWTHKRPSSMKFNAWTNHCWSTSKVLYLFWADNEEWWTIWMDSERVNGLLAISTAWWIRWFRKRSGILMIILHTFQLLKNDFEYVRRSQNSFIQLQIALEIASFFNLHYFKCIAQIKISMLRCFY